MIPGSVATSHLIWQAWAQDPIYPDGYKVMLAPNGGNTVADFTVELFSISAENALVWTQRSVDLSAYKGKQIRFAFVNNSNDKYILLIDNISIEGGASYCDAGSGNTGAAGYIHYVAFADMGNSSGAGAGGYQDFTNVVGHVKAGTGYAFTVQPSVIPNPGSVLQVWIDYNRDGVFDSSELVVSFPGTLATTGFWQGAINIPANVTPGYTRMRVR
jgi:hypothetical protein